jgi:hypothetical protein
VRGYLCLEPGVRPAQAPTAAGRTHARGVTRCPAAQDLTRDVVRIDAIPSTSLDTIRVRRRRVWSAQLTALRITVLHFAEHLHHVLACVPSSLATVYVKALVCIRESVPVRRIKGDRAAAAARHVGQPLLSSHGCRRRCAGVAGLHQHKVLREQDQPKLEAHPEEHHRGAPAFASLSYPDWLCKPSSKGSAAPHICP